MTLPDISAEANSTLFGKILRKEIPVNIVYEDNLCLAFRDITPQAPTHILIIPKKHIPKLADATPEDHALLGHLLIKTKEIAASEGLTNGYRTVINTGEDAGKPCIIYTFISWVDDRSPGLPADSCSVYVLL